MPVRIPARLSWAVDVLAPKPSDRLLEIGCGRGVVVSLICPLLKSGTITAIDRSPAAIREAVKRNRDHVRAGRAVLTQSELLRAEFGRVRFNKIFAVNVNLFWRGGASEAFEIVRGALAPRGTLYLFYELPAASMRGRVAVELVRALKANGYAVADVRTGPNSAALLCVQASRTR